MSRVTDHLTAAGGGADTLPRREPAASSFRAGEQTGDASGWPAPLAGRGEAPRPAFSSRLTARTLAVARAALSLAPLIRKGRAWLFVSPRANRKVRFFANETIAHLIAEGEAVRIGNVVRKISVCLCVASIVWSCVMPAYARPIAISISKLSRMSAAERAALDNPHLVEPKRAIVTVPVTSLAASTQAALVALSHHPVAKAVSARLKASTVRYNGEDFATLRALGLAEREPQTIFHRLTDEGRDYARGCAVTIARDLGLHEIWTTETSRNDRTAHCTCGWTAHVYSRHLSNHATFAEKVQRHLAEVTHGVSQPEAKHGSTRRT